jgi:hypothetical protein
MYCEDSEGTDIDHFCPKALEPTLTFIWENHLLACGHCNSNFKRTQFPQRNGERLLIDPSQDEPSSHLLLAPTTGEFEARDERGHESIRVFGLNRFTCVRGRANAFVALQHLLVAYRLAADAEQAEDAQRILDVIMEYPFQTVRDFLRYAFDNPRREMLIGVDVVAAIEAYPALIA